METSKQEMEELIERGAEKIHLSDDERRGMVRDSVCNVERSMLDHVFRSLKFHLSLANQVVEDLPFTETDAKGFYKKLTKALANDKVDVTKEAYIANDAKLVELMEELKQALRPTLTTLVSSLQEGMDETRERRTIASAYGMMADVEAIYSTYSFSRRTAFDMLVLMSALMDLPIDELYIDLSDKVRHHLDWHELDAYSYKGVFPYNPLIGIHMFTESAAICAVTDLFSAYSEKDDKLVNAEMELQKKIGEELLKISRFVLGLDQTKDFAYQGIEEVIQSFTWLHEGVKEIIEKVEPRVVTFTFQNPSCLGDELFSQMCRIESLFYYYEMMVRHYVYEVTGIDIDSSVIRQTPNIKTVS